MTREEIIKQINATMAKNLEVDEKLLRANIKDTQLDSLNLVDLVAWSTNSTK